MPLENVRLVPVKNMTVLFAYCRPQTLIPPDMHNDGMCPAESSFRSERTLTVSMHVEEPRHLTVPIARAPQKIFGNF
jgi:hypothetical protein